MLSKKRFYHKSKILLEFEKVNKTKNLYFVTDLIEIFNILIDFGLTKKFLKIFLRNLLNFNVSRFKVTAILDNLIAEIKETKMHVRRVTLSL